MSNKKQYPTSVQKSRLVEFLEADEELRQGKFSSAFTKKVAEERWSIIAQELNSLGGANKIWNDWRKTWQDIRYIRRTLNFTGGGPPAPPLSEHDTLVLNVMSDASVVGHADSEESMVCFKDVLGPSVIDKTFSPKAPAAASMLLPKVESNHCHNDKILLPEVPAAASVVVVENYTQPPTLSVVDNAELRKLEEPKCSNQNNTKKTMAQKRLQKSIDIAAALVQVLKEKNKIKKDFYDYKIVEMRRQSDALIQIANSLSHEH